MAMLKTDLDTEFYSQVVRLALEKKVKVKPATIYAILNIAAEVLKDLDAAKVLEIINAWIRSQEKGG